MQTNASTLPSRSILPSMTLALLFGCYLLWSSASAQSNDEGVFRTPLQSLFEAYEKNNLNQLLSLWAPESSGLKVQRQLLEKRIAAKETLRLISLTFKRIEVTPPTAKARVEIESEIIRESSTEKVTDLSERKVVVHFRQVNDMWLIWEKIPALEDLAERVVDARTEAERQSLMDGDAELVTIELIRFFNRQGTKSLTAEKPDSQRALTAYTLALNLALRLGNSERAATATKNIAFLWKSQGRYAEALALYQQSLSFMKLPENEAAIADLYNSIGWMHSRMNHFALARESYQKSLSLKQPAEQQALVALNLASLDYEQSNYDEALKGYQQVAETWKALLAQAPDEKSYKAELAKTYTNIGHCFAEKGEYEQALQSYFRGQQLGQEIESPVENVALGIGTVYEKQGQLEMAIDQYQKALAISRTAESRPSVIQTLTFLGSAYQALGDRERARSYLRQALELCTESAYDPLAADALNLLGLSFAAANNHSLAVEQFQKSMAKLQPINDRERMAESHYNLALSLLAQKNHAQALENIQAASQFASEIGKREWQWRAQFATGLIQQSLNHSLDAQQAFINAIATIESLRNDVAGGELEHQAFFENKTVPYLSLTELLLVQNKPIEALDYAERAKARALLDTLQGGKLNLMKAMTPAEQEQERKLKNELVSLNTQLYREQTLTHPNQTRLPELTAQLNKARLNYEDFRTHLYAAHPELKVQRGEAKTLKLEEAAELLPDEKTALLDYVVTPERVQLFVLTKSKTREVKLRVYPLAIKRDKLAAQVEEFRHQLAGRNLGYGKLAAELYGSLLKKAKAELPAQAKLVIVPDGPLWELPFQALLTERNRYLWQEHAICYAPSLTVLREMQKPRRESRATPSLFAIGDPALGGESVARVKALMGGQLARLPEAQIQVKEIQKFYDSTRSKAFLGAAATEEIVKAEAGGYNILHFATHGILNDRNPLYSHLLLAQAEAKSKEDGLLEAREIMQMDLRADLAVLSACETARGRVGAGEGMIGLTWALFVAGVPTTVVSQWEVRSDSTKDLMVEFHRLLQTANKQAAPPSASDWTKAEALRQAALKLLRSGQYRHPFYWAGFVLVGKPQ